MKEGCEDMLFISKGAPYIENKKLSVWNNGRIIPLTYNQQLLWKFFYGEIRTYKDLMKYMGKLAMTDSPMNKSLMQQTVTQLKSLNILSYSAYDEKIDRFILLFSNKIMPVKKDDIKSETDVEYYDLIEKMDSMSIADIIAQLCHLQYDKLTDGYTEDYLRYIYEKSSPLGFPNILMDSVLRMIKNGNLYIS